MSKGKIEGKIIIEGWQPEGPPGGNLDTSDPSRGGSGVPAGKEGNQQK